jgi:hypothetical protein
MPPPVEDAAAWELAATAQKQQSQFSFYFNSLVYFPSHYSYGLQLFCSLVNDVYSYCGVFAR